jgi:hypothetical protein
LQERGEKDNSEKDEIGYIRQGPTLLPAEDRWARNATR